MPVDCTSTTIFYIFHPFNNKVLTFRVCVPHLRMGAYVARVQRSACAHHYVGFQASSSGPHSLFTG